MNASQFPNEFRTTLENVIARKRLLWEMEGDIISMSYDSRYKKYSNGCALYASACDFISQHKSGFFVCKEYKNHYYALRMLIKYFKDMAIDTMTYGDPTNKSVHEITPQFLCGCENLARIDDEYNEKKSFYLWGPGELIKRKLPIFVEDINVAMHVWWHNNPPNEMLVWLCWREPENMLYRDFRSVFEADMRTKHDSWKHYSVNHRFAYLEANDRLFSAPHISDYAQVMLQIRLKTNDHCMRLVDDFCGLWD